MRNSVGPCAVVVCLLGCGNGSSNPTAAAPPPTTLPPRGSYSLTVTPNPILATPSGNKDFPWSANWRVTIKDEAALYDQSFQPYGSIWIMNADGTGKRQLTDSHWEDATPCFVPKAGGKRAEAPPLR